VDLRKQRRRFLDPRQRVAVDGEFSAKTFHSPRGDELVGDEERDDASESDAPQREALSNRCSEPLEDHVTALVVGPRR
jgi:hypothetical protein